MIAQLSCGFLSETDIEKIHDNSLRILNKIGLRVTSEEILSNIKGLPGFDIDPSRQIVRISETCVMEALQSAPKIFSVYGRDQNHRMTYGEDNFVCQSVPGEAMWVDPIDNVRRYGNLDDFEKAVLVADYLPNIDFVGAMIQPNEMRVETRDVHLYAELFKRTTKPVRNWVYDRTSAKYILKIAKLVAGGSEDLRTYPNIEFGFEPISPLILPGNALETAVEFARSGIPITIGPMPQAMSTAPVTLAGALSLGNAEILGTMAILETLVPETPIIYYNATHIADPKEMSLVFSSPEQALIGVAGVQIGSYYGLPTGINSGLTDSNTPDAQSGLEKGMTMVLGAVAGANIFGAMGIAGMDQGFSVPQLIIDDEIIGFVRRIMKGMRVDEESLAYEVIERAGIGGNFMMDDHTLENWRKEFWIPKLSDRRSWTAWHENGAKSMLERAYDKQNQIYEKHEFHWIDEDLQNEIDEIVSSADHAILGESA